MRKFVASLAVIENILRNAAQYLGDGESFCALFKDDRKNLNDGQVPYKKKEKKCQHFDFRRTISLQTKAGKHLLCVEAEFLDIIQTKVFRVFLLDISSHLYTLQLCLEISSNSCILLQFLQSSYCTL
jgi:hypothetical protein